jgi:nucleotidyltransferase substrate binding protein (TIGR01987 family)
MSELNITTLRDALGQLETGLLEAERSSASELLRDGVIQRFEYSHESAIRIIKRALETIFGDQVDPMPHNDLLRTAAERGLIEGIGRWMDYRLARNKTSHAYDEAIAAEVYGCARPFLNDAQFLLKRLDDIVG